MMTRANIIRLYSLSPDNKEWNFVRLFLHCWRRSNNVADDNYAINGRKKTYCLTVSKRRCCNTNDQVTDNTIIRCEKHLTIKFNDKQASALSSRDSFRRVSTYNRIHQWIHPSNTT